MICFDLLKIYLNIFLNLKFPKVCYLYRYHKLGQNSENEIFYQPNFYQFGEGPLIF